MRRILAALDRHWFAPASLRDLALVRIIVVSAQLFFFFPRLHRQIWLTTIEGSSYAPLPALEVLLLPFGELGARPGPMFIQAVWLLALVTGVLAVIGLFTRPSLLLFAATNTLLVTHGYSYGELHHPESLMLMALGVLALGPSGEALSVDDLRRRIYASGRFMAFRPRSSEEELSEFARWPLRTIQWLFVLVYLSAGLSKLANSGLDWVNGYTIGYFLLQDGLRWDKPLGVFLHDKNVLLVPMSVVVLLFELTFAFAVLVPLLTPVYIIAGIGIHVGIYVLQGAPFFQFIVLYVVLVDELRRAFGGWRRPRAPPAWTVIYDGACGLCIKTMVLLDYADLQRRLRFVALERGGSELGISPAAARHVMHVVSPDRRVFRGFHAFRRLARSLPVFWPLVPLLYAPLASTIGPAVYARVAASRCRSGQCATAGAGPPAEMPAAATTTRPTHFTGHA